MAVIEYKGDRHVTTLYEYYVVNGFPTGNVKPNTPGDPDYIPDETESPDCTTLYKYTNNSTNFSIQKNDCPAGMVGTFVNYTVPANKYMADTQQEVDDLVILDSQTFGQDFANASGSCV